MKNLSFGLVELVQLVDFVLAKLYPRDNGDPRGFRKAVWPYMEAEVGELAYYPPVDFSDYQWYTEGVKGLGGNGTPSEFIANLPTKQAKRDEAFKAMIASHLFDEVLAWFRVGHLLQKGVKMAPTVVRVPDEFVWENDLVDTADKAIELGLYNLERIKDHIANTKVA